MKKSENLTHEQFTDLEKKLEETTDHWKRALADYQNLVKRTESDKQNWHKFLAKKILVRFLPIIDTLEQANQQLKDKSIELVLKQFNDILKEEGVSEIEVEGCDFNPEFHESIDVIEGSQDNKVDKVYTKGYFFKDEVLRPAKVRVIKKKTEENNKDIKN